MPHGIVRLNEPALSILEDDSGVRSDRIRRLILRCQHYVGNSQCRCLSWIQLPGELNEPPLRSDADAAILPRMNLTRRSKRCVFTGYHSRHLLDVSNPEYAGVILD